MKNMKMKVVSIGCAAALSIGAALRAANVFPDSAAGYHFIRPALTNGIRGVVMGWPPEYRVIRSEDVDWVREANAERVAIMNTDGLTNWHRRGGVGPVVKRSDMDLTSFWNGWPRDDTGWLDGSVELTTVRVPHPAAKTTTNIYTYADTASLTNSGYYVESTTNGLSAIEMSFTNGTVSIHTNRWSWTYADRTTVVVPVTNVHRWTMLDWCQADSSRPFSGNTNAPFNGKVGWYDLFPAASTFSNEYQNLRSASRLADVGVNTWSNGPFAVFIEGYDGAVISTATSSIERAAYSLSATTYTNAPAPTTISSEWTHVTPATLYVPTRFMSALNSIGNVQRIVLEAAFVDTYFYYTHTDSVRDTREHISTNVLLRVLADPLYTSGGRMYAPIPFDARSLCAQASIAAGVDPPDLGGVKFQPPRGQYYYWDISLNGFVLIYRITPSAKFQDW